MTLIGMQSNDSSSLSQGFIYKNADSSHDAIFSGADPIVSTHLAIH